MLSLPVTGSSGLLLTIVLHFCFCRALSGQALIELDQSEKKGSVEFQVTNVFGAKLQIWNCSFRRLSPGSSSHMGKWNNGDIVPYGRYKVTVSAPGFEAVDSQIEVKESVQRFHVALRVIFATTRALSIRIDGINACSSLVIARTDLLSAELPRMWTIKDSRLMVDDIYPGRYVFMFFDRDGRPTETKMADIRHDNLELVFTNVRCLIPLKE